MGAGDITPVGPESETVVYYGSKSPSVVAAAQTVARQLTGSVILGYNPAMVVDGAQVTLVTGTGFSVNAPAARPSPGSATTSTPTAAPTTTTTSPANAAFAAPTSSNEALQPWDPRSCTASGGEGS
jgi:hypothetical protein